MKGFLKILKNVTLYIWQLPQNLVGLFVRLIFVGEVKHTVAGIDFWYCKSFPGGISLGNMVMIGSDYIPVVKHEYGHQIQSKVLGPLYLFIIGIPSLVHAWLHDCEKGGKHYYHFYTESWADKWAGIVRDKNGIVIKIVAN